MSGKSRYQAFVLLACLSAAAALTQGCGSSDSTSTQDVSVNGQAPQDAYARFYSTVEGECHRHGSINWSAALFENRSTGTELRLYVGSNGAYSLRYLAYSQSNCDRNHWRHDCEQQLVSDQWLSGTWWLSREKIVFSGLGAATYLTVNDQPAMDLVVSGFAPAPALEGQAFMGSMGWTSVGPAGLTVDAYCNR